MSQQRAVLSDLLDKGSQGLKPFQLATRDTVVEAFFSQKQQRFLVADEVGLGKTKIARAVVAETIRRHVDNPRAKRIDILYICSNQQIARQNIADLEVLPGTRLRDAGRITLIPEALAQMGASKVNLLAFTPGTSDNIQGKGSYHERAVLAHILEYIEPGIMARKRALDVLRRGAKGFDHVRPGVRQTPVHKGVARAFQRQLKSSSGIGDDATLHASLARLTDGRRRRDDDDELRLLGRMRRALAQACVNYLNPELVILDEFQRFDSMLTPPDDNTAGVLAKMFFDKPGSRVLLLSATPYRMLTNGGDDQSHAHGFEKTLDFLFSHDRDRVAEVVEGLDRLGRGIREGAASEDLAGVRDEVQQRLRRVMVRTERLASTPDRSGMLDVGTPINCTVTDRDIRSYLAVDRVVQALPGVPSVVEYWKSAPYMLNFMDGYKVKREIRNARDQATGSLAGAFTGPHVLDQTQLDRYQRIDPGNGRIRWLVESLDEAGAFNRLWVPPTLPSTTLGGAYATAGARDYTKQLIFSGWTVTPRAVASLVSYEYERRHHRRGVSRADAHSRSTALLTLPTETQGLQFSTMALFLPCRRLAELGDVAKSPQAGTHGLPVDTRSLRSQIIGVLEAELAPLTKHAGTSRSRAIWYAGAQVLLDRDILSLQPAAWTAGEADSQGLADHLRVLRDFTTSPEEWGAPPADLVEVLADIAIAGPAVAALRSLQHTTSAGGTSETSEADHLTLRRGAARLSFGLRSLFDTQEARSIIKGRRQQDYWRAVLRHSVEGCLSDVLTEWLHLLPGQLRGSLPRQGSSDFTEVLGNVVEAGTRVLTLKSGLVHIDDLDSDDSSRSSTPIRTHFAMRFGQATGQTADGDNPIDVMRAFNSPFLPFVLVSTSVGQEGLDFHYYSHAVVHWNLPRSPVELEQREGRVHRYKNHAVRKNLAQEFAAEPDLARSADRWSRLFELGDDRGNGMVPCWVYKGPHKILRQVPVLPMSRETGQLEDLVAATTLYRSTLGQARQSEILHVLARLPEAERTDLMAAVTLDLGPDTAR